MGSRVLQPGFAAKMNENDAKTGNDGLGGAGQNSEPSLHDSDAPGSVPSNGTRQMIFQLQRYDARVAYSAERAAELIAKWKPELAIVDVILPEMNGIDLAIVIKANYPKCHVILFSGHTNTSMLLEEAVRKGHNFEVLAKPVLPDLMLERASELLGTPDDPAYD